MSHRGDRYGMKYIQCNFIYRLSLQPWVSRCARGTVPWVHRDTHDWRLSPLYFQQKDSTNTICLRLMTESVIKLTNLKNSFSA